MKFVRLLLALAMALIIAPVADALAQSSDPLELVAEPSFDFGRVLQGETISHVFLLRNATDRPLAIEGAEISQPGLKARYRRIVPAGGEAKIVADWNIAQASGELEGQILLKTDDPLRSPILLSLTATVVPPIDVLPYSAAFFSLYRGETGEQSLTILNNMNRPVKLTGIDAGNCQCVGRLETIAEGREYKLVVTADGIGEPGRYRRSLTVLTDNADNARISIGVNVLIKSDVYANPEDVDFGRVKLADLAGRPNMLALLTQTFIVKKRQGELGITGVVTDLPFLAIARDPPGRSQIHRFDVGLDFEKLAAGPIDGSIRITTDDSRFPELIIPVRGILE